MRNRISMPFFWPKFAAHALLLGALATACSAGGGTVEGEAGDVPSFTGPSAPIPGVNNPTSTPAATNTSNVSPAANAPSSEAPASNAGVETLPTPVRDEDAQQSDDGDDPAANAPPANPDADDDGSAEGDDGDVGDDDAEADDDDDDGGEDDDDDGGGDDDSGSDDDDEGSDDGDGTGVTPPGPGNPPAEPNPPPAPDTVTFTDDIRPILLSNCGRCHASGRLPQLASADAATAYDVAFRERDEIVSEIRSGSMPADTCDGAPGSDGCVSSDDFALIQQWVAEGAPE